jgi:hypothetical protein
LNRSKIVIDVDSFIRVRALRISNGAAKRSAVPKPSSTTVSIINGNVRVAPRPCRVVSKW